jgi:hypothetical protein
MNEDKTNTEKAIFFLRHNNDIDHITPVLYKWLSTENIPTDVIITTKRSLLDDPRIEYLKKYKQVRIFHINDLFQKRTLPHMFNHYYPKYYAYFHKLIRKYSFVKKKVDKTITRIANELYKGMEKGIVVFDWTTTYYVKELVKIAKDRGFTTISLPHGDMPYVSLIETINEINYDGLGRYEASKVFDYVVVPNKQNTKRYEKWIEPDRLKVLGSPRYCNEWMKIFADFIPPFDIEESKDKLKIVFFLRNTGYPVFWDEVVRTIKIIMQFKGVYLIVKHHPRNESAKKLTEQLISKYPEIKQDLDKNLKFIYGSINSGSLLNWADVIIDIGTSVTWEAVQQKKPVLMIEYLYANHSTIAHYIPSTEVKSRDELYENIQRFLEKKNEKFYDENERRRFIKEIIDVPDEHVLERYVKFIKSCMKKED